MQQLKVAQWRIWLGAPPKVLEVVNVYATVVNTKHSLLTRVFVDELKNPEDKKPKHHFN